MSRSLRSRKNPANVINTAFHLYRSRGIRTWIVEGACDKRFFQKWIDIDKVRIDGFEGKGFVLDVCEASLKKPYSDSDFLSFFADIDYDVVSQFSIRSEERFYYHSYCRCNAISRYNDLESFLINSPAFTKFMIEIDQGLSSVDLWRDELERISRIFGSYRASDFVVVKDKCLASSVLDGLNVEDFLDARRGSVDQVALESTVRRKSPRKEYVEDLLECASRMREREPKWALSRGHDITQILSLILEARLAIRLPPEAIERMLRLACDKGEFLSGPVGCQMRLSGDDQVLV